MTHRCPHCNHVLRPSLAYNEAWLLYRDICARMGIAPQRLATKLRYTQIVEKRWIVAWVLRLHGARLEDIGAMLERSRTTISYGLEQLEHRLNSAAGDSWQRLIDIADGKRRGVLGTGKDTDRERGSGTSAGAPVNGLPHVENRGTPGV